MHFIASNACRLDQAIAGANESLSRSQVQKYIRDGAVTVDGSIVKKPAYLLSEGQNITVGTNALSSPAPHPLHPTDQELSLLYEDERCLVIDKPAGIAVHPGHAMKPGEETLLHGLAFLLQNDSDTLENATLVHRLDKETTGCLLVAKDREAHAMLQKQFEERTVQKTYLAITAGIPHPKKALIDAPIGRNVRDRTKMSILGSAGSREAKTTYEVLDTSEDASLLQLHLHTGRTHQIRVHLQSIGHPILGDTSYTSKESIKLKEHYALEGLCLHAWRLSFVSPADQREHTVEAPLSPLFSQALDTLRLTLG